MKHYRFGVAIGIAGAGLIVLWSFLNFQNHILKTRFVLHAAGRYVQAYELLNNDHNQIRSLADLPDFHLVSYDDSLSLESKDLRSRVIDGYFYDFQRHRDGGFVISASPLGPGLWGAVEFAVTDDGNLRVNRQGVDSRPDGYEEVKHWTIVPEWFDLRTMGESG